MKTDRKTKAEQSPAGTKAVKRARRVSPKSNGKHPLTAYEHIPIGIVETSLDGKYIDVNDEFCRILGYPRDEILHLGVKDCTHEDDYAIDAKLHEQLVTGKIPFYRLEKRFVRKSSGIIWVELTRTLVCDEKGNPLYTVGVVLDISDRKDVERVLRESVERLRLATETARMFMWEWDFQTYSYILADNFEQVLGFSADLLPKNRFETIGNLIPAEDVQSISAAFAEALAAGQDLHSQSCRVINPENGQLVWLDISAKIVYDSAGKPERLFGVAQNITESKKIQDEIAIISKMPEENPNPVMRLTPEGEVIYANGPGRQLLDIWKAQGKQGIPGEIQTLLQQAFASGAKKEIEAAQGGRTFSCTLAPIHEGGYINLYANDISGRKHAEEALRSSEERFRALVHQATAGIAQSDPQGRLTFVNPRFCEMLAYPEDELLGKTIWELTHPDDLPESRQLFETLMTAGKPYQFEKRFIRRDGSPRWTNVSVTTVHDPSGKPTGGVGVMIDIEERKQAEQSLTEFARQQKALYELSEQLYRADALDDVFDAALDAILRALQCDRASILLFDNKDVMRFVAWRGLSDEYRQATDGHSPWKPDTRNPQPVSMDDVRTADLEESLRAVIQKEGIGALAFIPLVINEKLIGKFMVYYNAPHTFADAELDLSLTIAHQLAFSVDRNRTEHALKRERETLERLFETMPVMVSMIDPETLSMRMNAEFERLLGWRSDQVTVASLLEALYPDPGYRSDVLQRMAAAAGKNEWVEVQVQTHDGRTLDSLWSNISIFEDQKLVTGIALGIDISERKQTEKRLSLLAEISEMLRNVEEPHELMYMISRAIGEQLKVKRVLFNEIDLQNDIEIVHRDYHNGLESVAGVHRVSEYSSSTSQEVASGKTVINVDSKLDPRTAQEYEKTYALTGERSYVVVPMMRENRWVASLWVSDDAPRSWTRDDVSLLETIAERTWTVIEKLRIDTELRESEERLRAMLETTVVGFATLTTDTRFVEVNDAFCRIVGYGREELLGMDGSMLIHHDYLELTNRKIAQLLSGEISSFVLEKIYIRKDGAQIWVQNSVSVIHDNHGEPLSLVAICQDVTERKNMEEQLRVREAELEEVINQTPFMLTRCTLDLRYRFVSRAYAEMIGRTPEEVAGKPIVEIMGEEGFKTVAPYIEKVLRGERVEYDSVVSFQGVGAPFLHVVYTPDWDEHGKVTGWFASILDISERKRGEERLRQSEERFRQAANASSALVYEVDLKSGATTIVHGMERLMGYDPQEIAVSSDWWHSLIHPDDLPAHLTQLDQLLQQGGTDVCEYRVRHRNGDWIAVQDNRLIVQEEAGDFLRLVGAVIDITERKRAEESLRRNEQMFSALINAAPFGVYYIDSEFRLRAINKGSEDVFSGIDPLIGRDFAEILRIVWQEPFATEAIERFRHTLRTGESFISPPIIEERANIEEIQSYDWQIHRILLPDGTYGVVCYFYDLSEQKRMEATVRASESLYRAIARSIPGGGVYVVDKDFRYLVAEGPVTEAFGLSRQMLEGHTVTEAFPDERGTRMEERLRRTFAGETVSFENEHEGRVFWTQQAPLYDSIGQAIILTIDITERKRAEEALRQSEERFARFMHHLPGLAWIKDMQGRYVYANAAAEQAFRAPSEKLYGSTDEEIFPPETAAQFRSNDQLALTDEKGVQVIETLPHPDGVLHYSLVNKFPIPGPDGETSLIGGTAFDITERLKAEEALQESEERFRAILRQATAGIVRKDAEGRLIFVNQAFCNMLEYTEADLLGKTIWDVMHEEDIAENKRLYERLMQDGIPFKLERRLIREDGSVIWVDASVSPIMDAAGRPQSAVTVEVDITARKQAEEALQQLNLQLEERVLSRTAKLRSVNQTLREEIVERQKAEEALRRSEAAARANEEKLSTLFKLLPVGISFLDPEGQIIEMNPALAHILKLSPEQLADQQYKSRKYIRANGTLMAPSELASRRAMTEGKTVYNVETGIVLEDSEVIWTSVSAAPVDVANVGAVIVTADITESKRAERALQESRERLQILSQRLVEVQEEERRAIARELHDRVGQTLAALNINLIIISGQLGGKVDEQVSTRLSDSMKLVAETIALVRDVMSNLRPAVLDDYGLQAALESHVSQYTSRYEIQVQFDKPQPSIPRLGPSMEMTFLRIAQEALMNIARHAQASQVRLSLWQQGNAVWMTIQDNGTGITSWQEANRPGSHGLTIMRERAEAFGGSLRVSSAPGKGTTLEVSIPVETNNPPPLQKEMNT